MDVAQFPQEVAQFTSTAPLLVLFNTKNQSLKTIPIERRVVKKH
jgi:hypothetical protein